MKGYALIAALEVEANEIATERRAELVRDATRELKGFIEENKRLLAVLERVWQHPHLMPSICGTTDGEPLVKEIRSIVGG